MVNRRVAVVGPGRMGIGIVTAVLMAGQGHSVILLDTKHRERGLERDALEKARGQVAANLELLCRLGAIAASWEPLLDHLRLEQGFEPLRECSLVFEALPETVEAKRPFYEEAGRFLREGAVIASATSTFDVRVFASMYAHPRWAVAAHWLNPAFLIPLVEIARTQETAADAVEELRSFLAGIGKIPVIMRSSPGFVVPRIQAAAMNEAVRILEEGVASAEEIDTAIKAGFGFRLAVLGLIEFIDLGGVDILARAGEYLCSALGQPQFRPPALVAEKMASGEIGAGVSKGFFDYTGVNTRALFDSRYQGFLELLELYRRSDVLHFGGGITEAPKATLP
ncbi:MAG: 3-hydroxyacyl-CoA dehydrogenase [Deltaproteobacteria bacterium]|nr:3-hydroxyacyl-CoA dehydrogenase [Deltaproteobacteria bacterium]